MSDPLTALRRAYNAIPAGSPSDAAVIEKLPTLYAAIEAVLMTAGDGGLDPGNGNQRATTPDNAGEDGLRELRALSEAATPGPWGAYISYSGESGTPDEAGLFVNDKAHDVDGEKQTIISDFSLYASEHLPDLEFIVAAVNYVRAALASTERAATPDNAGRSPIDVEALAEALDATYDIDGTPVRLTLMSPDGTVWTKDEAEYEYGSRIANSIAARLSESTGSASSEQPDR
jgi:hypothetical protein